jgi:hypothetical protein
MSPLREALEVSEVPKRGLKSRETSRGATHRERRNR